jgi:hypothetical protein
VIVPVRVPPLFAWTL